MFNELYKKLNPAQKEAVDTIEGPVMVVAGPGTGKTQVLTLRIANILQKTDTAPENILALTFTDAAGQNMRRRLTEIIGPAAYRVVINTFHSFCNDIIKNYPEEFPRIIGSRQITEIDQIKIIEELVDKLDLDILRPFGDRFLYVRDILGSINELKREGRTPAEFQNIVEKEKNNFKKIPDLYHEKGAHQGKMKGKYQKLEKQIKKNSELALIYEAYEKILQERKIYDYGDMIMEVLKTLQTNENLLRQLQEEYQYVLVDEHQDTNNAQNKIIELLMSYHQNPNIFVVGDEKQAIFRFQGASLENFLYFKNLYPEAKIITLTENYRSTQNILDSAHSLLPSNLKANTRFENKKIHLAAFSSPEAENYFLAQDIKLKIESGVPAEEIAILYRDNKDAFSIARMLEKFGLPYVIESDEDLFSDGDVRKIIILLRAINNYGEDEFLVPVLHLDFLNIPPLEVYKLIRKSHEDKKPLYDLIPKDLAKKLSQWARLAKNENLLRVFETVFEESGMLRYLMEKGNIAERFETMNAFFDELKGLVESNPKAMLADFFKYLETIEKHNLNINKRKFFSPKNKVRLMTVHRAKGLEFDYVYIIVAHDGHFGGRRSLDRLPLLAGVYLPKSDFNRLLKSDFGNDERRLFYVALTRARKGVTITYSKISDTGREQLPSQFITEIKKDLIEELEPEKFEKDLEEKKSILFQTAKKEENEKINKEFVKNILEKNGLSVTALNNYLECPWNYFYSNLLRLPKAKNKHMMYGTAIHYALRDFFSQLKDREIPKENLLQSFEFYLNKEPLVERDFQEVLEKGKKALSGYYDKYYKTWPRNVLTEYEIKGVDVGLGVHLTGKLDKIEFIDGDRVNVVDYKTRQPLSKNEIEKRGYKRQLVFYQLLLDQTKYKMISGELDFIEPNERGSYKKEKFIITEEDLKELKETIARVIDEILNLKFWDKLCGQKECQYCRLREIML